MDGDPANLSKQKRNYPLLLASQFLSAFGDNLILMIILGPFLIERNKGLITEQQQSIANVFYTSLLFVPYVLLAPLAGYLNDRFSKNRALMAGNLFKLIGAAITAAGIGANKTWLGVGYFVVGIGACVYSPAKYGILPEILPKERLVKANGLLELLTLVAILTGNIAGAMAFDRLALSTCYAITMAIYALSLALNLVMTRTPFYREVQFAGISGEFFHNVGQLFSQKRLARILVGTALFWVCGAVLKMNFQPWGQRVLNLQTMTAISLLGLWLSIGVMAGSVLAGQLYAVGDLRATRRYGWLLAGGILALGSVRAIVDSGFSHVLAVAIAILIVTGLIAGLFLIPLNAALQAESHKDRLGKTIATQNGMENLAMLGGSAIAYLNVKIDFNPSQLLLVLAVFVAVVVVWLKIPPKQPLAENGE
ncbi:MAG TPA: MFS transporter [Verrucomicrobiae bacterium]|jgi:LPLT family lysophospholipid transporter-like MFS transporter